MRLHAVSALLQVPALVMVVSQHVHLSLIFLLLAFDYLQIIDFYHN